MMQHLSQLHMSHLDHPAVTQLTILGTWRLWLTILLTHSLYNLMTFVQPIWSLGVNRPGVHTAVRRSTHFAKDRSAAATHVRPGWRLRQRRPRVLHHLVLVCVLLCKTSQPHTSASCLLLHEELVIIDWLRTKMRWEVDQMCHCNLAAPGKVTITSAWANALGLAPANLLGALQGAHLPHLAP